MMYDLQNHKPLREIVYEELKRRIVTGEIPPGERMMEIQLSEDLGVSRTPVREAIHKLEKEGLVLIEPRRGARSSIISMQDIIDVLAVRQDLEGLAAEMAAAKISAEEIEKLDALTRKYDEAIKAGDTEKVIAFDEDFHKAIVAVAGNRTLETFVLSIQELVKRFRYIYYDNFNRYKNMPGEHQRIIAALESGDGARARETANEHVATLKEFVIREGRYAFR